MTQPSVPPWRSHVTLALTTVLHAFTHAYGVLLVPLYLLMVRDLHLTWVKQASLIVAIYGIVYNLSSYPAGVLADRFDRKWLLGLALIGNAIAIGLMGVTKNYSLILSLGIIAGLFGTLFHPCANSMIPAHYPKSPGMAIGLLGIGSGLGFFMGPQFAGWRAQAAHWQWGDVADWQRPCIELAIIGVAVGVIYLIVAREARTRSGAIVHDTDKATLPDRMSIESIVLEYSDKNTPTHTALGPARTRLVLFLGMFLGLRDFSGIASISLTSLYLQKAHGYDAQHAGLIVGGMMLLGILANPVATWLTPGKRRLPGLALALIGGGLAISTVPWWPAALALVPLALYQTMQLGSYAISDGAMMERVPAELRGRVVGVFLTIAGTLGGLAPFAMGYWVDQLRERAQQAHAYFALYGTLGAMIVTATGSIVVLSRLERLQART